MTAVSLDSLSGGRFRLGLGVSGPQVSEGWHGVRFGRPLARTREYVDVVRTALDRRPVAHEGEFFTLPLPDGPGKALRLTHTHRADVPIYLAAVGPKNLQLAGEIADGWLGVFVAPDHLAEQKARLDAGLARRHTPASRPFELDATFALAVGDDLEACVRTVSPYPALYVGGMGSREQNFYNQLACRMGYEEQAARIQDLYLAGKKEEAMAAVPQEFLDATSMVGDEGYVRDRIEAYRTAGVTRLQVHPVGEKPLELIEKIKGWAS